MKRVLILLLLVPFGAGAQVTITSSDIPHNIGDWMVTTGDSIDLVNVGPTGGPHHWEFQLVNPTVRETTYVRPPGDSPVSDSFPSANLLYVTETGSGPMRGTHYAHYDFSTSSLLGLGWATEVLAETTTVAFYPPSVEFQFPTDYLSAWTSDFSYTVVTDQMFDSYITTTVDRDCVVDAWGTVTTPIGTFNTLRNRSTGTTIVDTYFMGALIWSDTSDMVGFSWLVARHGPIVNVIGDSVLQDTLVPTPSCYSLATHSTVSTGETAELPTNGPLSARILGNPTSLPFRMEVELGTLQPASIEIYDVSGRLVHRFDDVASGILQWNGILDSGQRIPAGVYVVNLRTHSWNKTLTVSIM